MVQTDYASAISDAIGDLRDDLEAQIEDGKIETFYQSADPSTNWTTEQKTAHAGDLWYKTSDLWYKTSDSSTWRWSGSAWQEQSVPDEVFDAIDGKSTIFYGTTSGTYTGVQKGDYLVDSTTGSTYRYTGSAWTKVTDYSTAISNLDSSLDQEEVFNRLTGNKTQECIRLVDGHLYINASWINSGTMTANLIKAGILKSQDTNTNFSLNMLTGEIVMKNATFTGKSRLGYYPTINSGKIALTDSDGNDSVLIEEGSIKLYGLDTTLYGRIKARDTLTYTTRFGLELWSNNHVVINAPDLIFENYMSIVNYNRKCGINEDSYGVALFNQGNNSNCFVRCNPGGTVDISAPNGFYVNGVKVGS